MTRHEVRDIQTRSTNSPPIAPTISLVLGGAIGMWIGTFALLLGLGPQTTALAAMAGGFLLPLSIIGTLLT